MSCVDRASEVYVLRLAILAILLTTIIIAAPLAAEHGLEAVVYPDGSVKIVGSLKIEGPGLGTESIGARVEGFVKNGMLKLFAGINASVELEKPLTKIMLRLSSSYNYTSFGYEIHALSNLFENLSKQGWIKARADVRSAFHSHIMTRYDNVTLLLVAGGKMSDVVRASVFLNPFILQSQLRSAGITWVKVLEARSRLINSSAALITIRLETNVSKMLRAQPPLRGRALVNPPQLSMKLELILEAFENQSFAELAIIGEGDVAKLGAVIDQALLLPTVGAGGTPVSIPMIRPLADVLSNVTALLNSIPWLTIVPSNFSLVVETIDGTGMIHFESPRFKALGSSNPLTALSLLAYGLRKSEPTLPQWLRAIVDNLLRSRLRIVPANPSMRITPRIVTLEELSKLVTVTSPRTLSISISVPHTVTHGASRASITKSVTSSVNRTKSYPELSTRARVSSGWSPGLLSAVSAAVGVAAIAVAIAIYSRRRY